MKPYDVIDVIIKEQELIIRKKYLVAATLIDKVFKCII